MNVRGKVAVVTGASGGIGKATARLFTEKGASVVLTARSKSKLEKISRNLTSSFVVVAHMSKPADIKRLITRVLKRFGKIDILINNAGRGYDAGVEFINANTYRAIFEVDVVAPILMMQQVVPVMRKYGGGSIVNISSGTALMILPNQSPYASLKQALAHISQVAGKELKKDHISVSVVYPYITKTDFEKHTIKGKQTKMDWGGDKKLPTFDEPDFVAKKILEAVETESPEIFAHDWMRKNVS